MLVAKKFSKCPENGCDRLRNGQLRVDAAQKFKWMFTENRHSPTVITISFPLTLCAIKETWSTLSWKEQKKFQEEEKQWVKHKPFCEIIIIPCLSKLQEGVNQTTCREQLQWLCSAAVCTERFLENRSHFETTKGQSSFQTTTKHQQPFSASQLKS